MLINQSTNQPINQSLTRLFFNPFLLVFIISLSLSLACSSSGGSSPASPTGLFLRPTGDANTKVYSNGQGLLLENSDGSTNEIVIGTFDHDRLTPYNIEDEDDGAGHGDDISVDYSYSLAANAGDDYSNTLFSTNNNQLSFIDENSGVLGETPPYKLSIETALNVKIELPTTFNGYINTDASNDDTDADTRKFAFSGGTISKTDVAATEEVAAYRTISVTAGNIYAPDTSEGTGKIINFEALASDKLPATPDIYQYYVIVTDENNDGTGEVSAVAELPTGTEFYVIGEVGAHAIQEVTVNGIKFTDKPGGGIPDIKVLYKTDGNVEISIDGNAITIRAIATAHFFDDVLTALRDPKSGVTALVDVTTVAGYTAGGASMGQARLGNTDFGSIYLSGGVDADTAAGTAAVQAQVTIVGLTIVATSNKVGAASNRVNLNPVQSGSDDSNIALSVLSNGRNITLTYGNDATLGDLITAINADTAANAVVDFVGTATTFNSDGTVATLGDYDPNSLLIDVLLKTYAMTPEAGAKPTANETGKLHNTGKVYSYETFERLDTEDYIINLAP